MAVKTQGLSPLDIAGHLIGRWDDMKMERRDREEIWQECAWAYACRLNKKWAEAAKAAGRSARYYPALYDAAETIVPQVEAIMYSSPDWLKVLPTRQGGGLDMDDELAEDVRQLLRYQLDMMKFNAGISEDAARALVVFGNAPYQVFFDVKKAVNYPRYAEAVAKYMADYGDLVAEYNAAEALWQQEAQAAAMVGLEPPPRSARPEPPMPPVDTEVIYAGPKVRVGSIFNYCEEMYPNNEETALRAYRSKRTREWVKRMARPDETGYRLFENIASMGSEGHIKDDQDGGIDDVMASVLRMSMPNTQRGDELITFTGTFEIGNKVFDNHIAVVGNRHGLIRCEPLPLFSGKSHIRNAKLFQQPGDPYGIGVFEKALGLQDTANAQANQAIDAVAAVIQPEMEVVYDGLYDALKPSGPGARHFVREKGTINPIVKNMQGLPVGQQQLAHTLAKIEQTTGAAYAINSGDPRESATKTAGRGSVMGARITHIARRVESQFLEPVLEMMIEYDAQYLDDDQFVVVTQGSKVDWRQISPQAIRRGWLIRAAGAKLFIDEEAKAQRDLMMIQTVTSNPALFPIVDIPYMVLKWLKNAGYEDADRIVKNDEESRQIMVQLALAMIGVGNDAGPEGGRAQGQADPGAPGGAPGGGTGGGTGAPGEQGIDLAALLGLAQLGGVPGIS